LLLRKLPVLEPDSLVLVESAGTIPSINISERAAYEQYRKAKDVFSDALAFSPLPLTEVVHSGHSFLLHGDHWPQLNGQNSLWFCK
jgi:hypothetical protein